MAKKNSYIQYTLVLGIITFVCSLGMAFAYSITRDAIAANKAKVRKEAMGKAMPGLYGEPEKIGTEDAVAYIAKNEAGEIIGYLAEGRTTGYGGEIVVMTGLKSDLSAITGISVIAHSETPGLGAKVDEIKTDKTVWSALGSMFGRSEKIVCCEKPVAVPEFQKQFIDRGVKNLKVVKVEDGESVVAITAATITSNAVVKAVKDAVETVHKALGQTKKDKATDE